MTDGCYDGWLSFISGFHAVKHSWKNERKVHSDALASAEPFSPTGRDLAAFFTWTQKENQASERTTGLFII